jgi:DNA primase
MRTAEGRAKFLQEAKPLVKQVPAPMLSLMLRKQVAELAGISQAELDRSFEIKVASRPQAPERRTSIKPSLIRALVEMLAYQPSLALLADAERLRENDELASGELPQTELIMLGKVLDLCGDAGNVRSIAEYFRGGEFAAVAQEIEAGSLKWEELDNDALRAEFVGAWETLVKRFRHVRITLLLEKSKRQSWTPEEKEQFRRLQQGTANETPG